jgi:transcriptional regulator with XRE-family HTH domain
MSESIGSMLRRHRLAASLTQEELAERSSLSSTAIAALERGRSRAPRLTTLRQLARTLDLSPEQLAELSRAAATTSTGEPIAVEPTLTGHRTESAPVAAMAAISERPDADRSNIPLPPAAARRWRMDFVGRIAEVDRLRALWDERRRLTEVVGESGIGKTRLVAELARLAHHDGSTVLWGRCNQDRLGTYLPFVEISPCLPTSSAITPWTVSPWWSRPGPPTWTP